jgi:choice-of-anchor A domain-containing protein
MRLICKSGITVAALWFAGATASAGVLGIAGNYNAFVFTLLSATDSSSEGALAVGGDVSVTDYTIGTSTSTGTNLVVAGDLSITNGLINGSAITAGSTTIFETGVTGDITTGGDYTGDSGPTNGGTIFYGGTYAGPPDATHQQVASVTLPVDFPSVETQLTNTSDSLAALTNTGSSTDDANDLVFTGAEDGQNVFSVDADDLANATKITFNIPPDATAIINVIDADDSGTAFLPDADFDFDPGQVVWNFDNFSAVLGSSFAGSILAPTSVVALGDGGVRGTIVADILTTDDEVLTIPLPSSVWAGLVLLGGLWISRRAVYR